MLAVKFKLEKQKHMPREYAWIYVLEETGAFLINRQAEAAPCLDWLYLNESHLYFYLLFTETSFF